MKSRKNIRIIATSDLHGKFLTWDYALNQESKLGSMTQLSTALNQFKDHNTILVDAGDSIQDNFAEIFLDDAIHPMIKALNLLNYDLYVMGNHEFDYGMDVVKKTVYDLDAQILIGNVYEENGSPLARGYTIIKKHGIRIAFIGMVTPNIKIWNSEILKNITVTNPLEETQRIIACIQGQYDILIGIYHMGIKNEYNVAGSGVTDLCNACPEFDLVISSHEHMLFNDTINDIRVVQNMEQAQTMMVMDFELEPADGHWKVIDLQTRCIHLSSYESDSVFDESFIAYDEKAKAEAVKVIGTLEGGPLAVENEIADIPTAQIEDTPLIDLINEVQMYYSGAAAASTSVFDKNTNVYPGPIKRCDLSLIYKYANTLYKYRMTGSQFKKYMEWSAGYYNTYKEGDLTISFNPEQYTYDYDIFDGVCYDINISKEPGKRIENLTWTDGSPVLDTDIFEIAVNSYRGNIQFSVPGVIFESNDMPVLIDMDIMGNIGGVRELIGDYIANVKKGVITSHVNNNWRITGNDWDDDLHDKAVELISAGEIVLPDSGSSFVFASTSVRVEDVEEGNSQ